MASSGRHLGKRVHRSCAPHCEGDRITLNGVSPDRGQDSCCTLFFTRRPAELPARVRPRLPPAPLPARKHVLSPVLWTVLWTVLWAVLLLGFVAGSLIGHASLSPAHARPLEIPIASDDDDGVEVNDHTWHPYGSQLILGRTNDITVFDVGLRFHVSDLAGIDSVLFARLRFTGCGGIVEDTIDVNITGALEVGSPPLWQGRRPSHLPRTNTAVHLTTSALWQGTIGHPVYYYTDDLSAIINEIISQSGWPAAAPALVLCLDYTLSGLSHPNYVAAEACEIDYRSPCLEVCRTLEETFVCREILGRVTDQSVTVSFSSLIGLEVYVEYGTETPCFETTPVTTTAGEMSEIVLGDLPADTPCSYRLRYRALESDGEYETGELHHFHTQRAPGESFTFTVQTDSHLSDHLQYPAMLGPHTLLYESMLANVAADDADFHVSLGDFVEGGSVFHLEHMRQRYALQHRFLDTQLHSLPFFFVLGNRDGELGWRRESGSPTVAWAEQARREALPNPFPDDFYGGCSEPPLTGSGYRESYYAFEWGDALFVTLDPFWYTVTMPYGGQDQLADGDGWAWTLGWEQYEWLYEVLSNSQRQWKIVLIHHLTSGTVEGQNVYGRGGIEVSEFQLASRPTFEWGGQGPTGELLFQEQRPGWSHGSVHSMLVSTGVDLVLHGHDHFFAFQQLDGIAYVLCPQACDPEYGAGMIVTGGYDYGVFVRNSGHVRVRVEPDDVTVEYVRAFLPGDGVNGEVAFSRSLVAMADQSSPASMQVPGWWVESPARQTARVMIDVSLLTGLGSRNPRLWLYDLNGRVCNRIEPSAGRPVHWALQDAGGRPLPAGWYVCRLETAAGSSSKPLLVLR